MKMKHEEIREKLFALADGPLTEKERTLVEGHLDSCPECRQALREWRLLSNALFLRVSFSEAEEDRFVSTALERAVSASPRHASSWPVVQWLLPLVGSAVAAAWVLFSMVPAGSGFASGNSVGDFLSGDSAEVMSSNWSLTPESASTGGIILASYGER